MNLNNLKPAWERYRFFNSMESIDQQEILCLIELADSERTKRFTRILVNTAVLIFLIVFCQGG